MGAAPPRPRRVGSAPAAPRPSACRLWGAAPPTAPSRRSTRCARLWPAHPPSEFLSVGAAPPRPRRVGSATAAPRPSACRLWGAQPPTPPKGWQRPRGPEAERVSSVGGCAPHAPIADEHALRAALARPPAEFLSVGAAPPRPRRVGSATAAPRAGARRLWGAASPPAAGSQRDRTPEGAPMAGPRGGPCCRDGSSDSRGCGGVGAQPPHEERIRGGWVGQSRPAGCPRVNRSTLRVLVRVPRKQQGPRRPRDQRALCRQSPCWPWPPPAAWISLPRTASSRSRIATASSAASWS